MKHFPTMKDVEELINQEQEKKKLKNAPHCMEFSINKHLSEDKRLEEVTVDIAIEYPELPRELRRRIAALEEPIKGCHEDYDMFYKDELRIYRLFNILQLTHSKVQSHLPEDILFNIYTKALNLISGLHKRVVQKGEIRWQL